jgi:hypothetical protein
LSGIDEGCQIDAKCDTTDNNCQLCHRVYN